MFCRRPNLSSAGFVRKIFIPSQLMAQVAVGSRKELIQEIYVYSESHSRSS